MEGLEEGVAQPSEHYPGNPGVDPDPEWNDWQWPRDIATPENPLQVIYDTTYSTERGHHAYTQNSSEGREEENARTGIGTCLQSGHEGGYRPLHREFTILCFQPGL